MDVLVSYNDHGVRFCNRTERTDTPEAITRMSFRGGDTLIAREAVIVFLGRSPFYRDRNGFGMDDGGDAT